MKKIYLPFSLHVPWRFTQDDFRWNGDVWFMTFWKVLKTENSCYESKFEEVAGKIQTDAWEQIMHIDNRYVGSYWVSR